MRNHRARLETLLSLALTALLLAPAAAADDLESAVRKLAKVGACIIPSFSPDSKQLTFIGNMTGTPQLWTIGIQGGWPDLITDVADAVTYAKWSPAGDWIGFATAPGNKTGDQIYLVSPDGIRLHRVTDGGTETNWFGTWSPNGRLLGYTSNREKPEIMQLYLYDPARNESRRVTNFSAGVSTLEDLSHDGKYALVWQMINRGDSDFYLVELATGKTTLLTPHQPPGDFENGRFAPDSRTAYFTSNKDREFTGLARVRLGESGAAGEAEIVAARDDADLQSFEISKDGRTAVLVWNVAGSNEMDFLDLATLKVTPGPKLPAELAITLRYSNSNHIAMWALGPAMPPNVFVLDPGASEFRQVTRAPHPGVDLTSLVRPELVRFKAHDGLDLSGWLYRPNGAQGPLPLVIIAHGGPQQQERPSWLSTYQALLTQGIAIFAPNFRGSSGFGKTFTTLDNGPLRDNAVKDIKSAVDFVVEKGIADPKRLGIFGFSYGGFLTVASVVDYPELFAAAVDLSGIVNFETFFAHTEPWMASISAVEYGHPQKDAEMLRRLSPIHRIDRIKAPTLVIHGANDTNVPVSEAEQIVQSLKQRQIPVRYMLFPDEAHGIQKESNRIEYELGVVGWFAEYLKGASGKGAGGSFEAASPRP